MLRVQLNCLYSTVIYQCYKSLQGAVSELWAVITRSRMCILQPRLSAVQNWKLEWGRLRVGIGQKELEPKSRKRPELSCVVHALNEEDSLMQTPWHLWLREEGWEGAH